MSRADRAKSSFLAAASHDLRQPLQTLRMLQGTLEWHHPHGEARKIVADMGHSLDTMSSMLSSLLDINQLESGKLSPSKSDFRIDDIFDSMAADFSLLVEEKGLQWRLVRSAVTVHSDKRMMEEILRNLLSNAIRYTDRGKILVGCRRSGDKVRIEVWDSGVGIAQDQLPYIFEEYFQGAIDEVRIYNKALTTADIQTLYQQTATSSSTNVPGLVAYWNFDEGSGTIAADSSGNGNNGTLVNGPSWTNGIKGKALLFDGVDDNVTVPNSNSLNLANSFTLSAWVFPTAAQTKFTALISRPFRDSTLPNI